MQAYVSLGSRTPAERSTPLYPTRQYRQIGRPNGNRLETLLTPSPFRTSNFNLNHGTSYVTLNDNSNSSSFFSGATSPMSSVPSQFTPNQFMPTQYAQNQFTSNHTHSHPVIRHRSVPSKVNQPRLECRTQIVRETDPITGELLPPIKVAYTVQSATHHKPITKEYNKALLEFERVQQELNKRSPLASLR